MMKYHAGVALVSLIAGLLSIPAFAGASDPKAPVPLASSVQNFHVNLIFDPSSSTVTNVNTGHQVNVTQVSGAAHIHVNNGVVKITGVNVSFTAPFCDTTVPQACDQPISFSARLKPGTGPLGQGVEAYFDIAGLNGTAQLGSGNPVQFVPGMGEFYFAGSPLDSGTTSFFVSFNLNLPAPFNTTAEVFLFGVTAQVE